MRSSSTRSFIVFTVLLIAILPHVRGHATSELHFKSISPFSSALETLQKQLGYTFKSISLLRRAMTHASFSEENNKAFSILGASVIETSVSFQLLSKDVDVSAKELNTRLSQISNVDSSCAVDGMRLGLHKVVRVSPKTNSSAPAVVCGAFRAIFGAIAIDTGKSDAAGNIFWTLHGGDIGAALAL
ncbi:protein NUCLEAR FUSION DEFECTIVE 2 [Gastrolobium bilobum]|uniref:protein NUCLEAR FUSION DEFECTIVE 2 n=1 Tax=Gastrolobium bilobum TaxID=150636 RepID=UPI002AB0D75D|nr:protein NUCLEAR FUSION DEFECTIVE 2 [Gastrolobium bilobum]